MTAEYFDGTEVAVERARRLVERDPDVRAAMVDEGMLAFLRDERNSTLQLFAEACRIYAARPALAERPRARVDGVQRLERVFRSTSYATLWARVERLAAGWVQAGLVQRGDFVGICGFASIDFVVAELACLYVGAISVPLQTTVTATDLRHIVAETGMRTIVCGLGHLAAVSPVLGDTSVRSLVVMDVWPGDELPAAQGVEQRTMTSIEERAGAALSPDESTDPDRLVSILYTSGSTGAPKGAMYLDRTWARRLRYGLREPPVPILTVGCMPLNHVMGRFTVHRTMMRGGLTSFVAASDMSTLLEDIRLARPTTLTIVPRATAAMHQHYQTRVVELGAGAEAQVLAEMSDSYLGDRLCLVLTGSAATPHDTVVFLERCFGVSVVQFYAFNEFGSVSVNEHVDPDVEYRLEDVPELGYSTKDRPYPRGELLVRSRYPTAGYYKLPDLNAHLRDAEGFMRSGDVMEERAPGHLVWIDRKNNVVKLSQGEFVSLTRIEELLQGSPFITQVFIYASSKRAYLLAVVVPDHDAAQSAGARDDGSLRALLASQIMQIGEASKLPRHEVPRDFVIAEHPFTKENGLLTESGKPKRAALKAAYGVKLEALYTEIEARQLAVPIEDLDAEGRARAAIAATLGLAELDGTRSFVGLGGDSFNAVRLSGLLERALGVAAPVSALLDPHVSIAQLVARLAAGADRPQLAELAGANGRLEASALALERFLPAELLAPRAPPAAPRSVLLTGASGFLGRFLLLELLERVDRVVCVVRGADDVAARARVDALFEDELRARFERVAARLEVVAGDLAQPRFGLEEQRHRALADELDAVVHNGALVNHALTYAQLLEPNVLGTIEVIRFVLTGRPKSMAFVSSSGVAAGLGRVVREDETAASLWASRLLDAGESGIDYAAGYTTSKWASEVLLDDLHRRTSTPVQIFRCSMILPPRIGHVVNDGDNVTRLLRGLLATGIAPRSLYTDEGPAHFDGVPVDVVAAAISAIALEAEPGEHAYHVSNARWGDGVSLDAFAEAIAARHPLVRLDYAAWFDELRVRLEKLDEPTRRRSPLPIIGRWAQPSGSRSGIRLDNARFRAKLRALLGLDDVPELDAAYLAHVVDALLAT